MENKKINARKKGHDFERRVVKDFKSIGYTDAGRQLEYQKAHALGVDLENTGPYAVQTKAKNCTPNIPEVFKQIKAKGIPVVIFKVTPGKGEYMVMKLKDGMKLLKPGLMSVWDGKKLLKK